MTVFIIGAGPGGYETALAARKAGAEVILAESGQIGGTCLNAGCIPTKCYCRSAEIMEGIRSAADFGISAAAAQIDFPAVKARKDGIVAGLRENIVSMLGSAGVTVVRGLASFKDSRTVTVGGTDYTADCFIIATGSVPTVPDIPGISLPGVIGSTEALDLETLPASLCIIGGGVIGLEFASIFRSFGTEVTVVEYCREILPRFDQDIARRLRQSLSRRGITFSVQSRVSSVESLSDGRLRVNWMRKDNPSSCDADKVLLAAGRRPDSSALHLERAGVDTVRGAVVVDDDMRTSVPHIFAIGDVNGRQLLAHAAVFQGKVALRAILKDGGMPVPDDMEYKLSIMPSAVFTMPEAASVGLTEEDCKAASITGHKVFKSFFRANGKAVCLGETDGMCKLIAAADGRILGCHICGPHSADMVQEISSLMTAGATAGTLAHSVHIHPTLSEILADAVS